MKYLKKFNENIEYYSKIDELEGQGLIANKIDFKLSEINKILSISNDIGYSKWNSNIEEVISLRKIKNKFLNIYKYTDEWYVIMSESGRDLQHREFWKCDQLDGLEKFLKDIIL